MAELKDKIRIARLQAAVKVNTGLILVFWQLGRAIVEKKQKANEGQAFIEQLFQDLNPAFYSFLHVPFWYMFYVSCTKFPILVPRQFNPWN